MRKPSDEAPEVPEQLEDYPELHDAQRRCVGSAAAPAADFTGTALFGAFSIANVGAYFGSEGRVDARPIFLGVAGISAALAGVYAASGAYGVRWTRRCRRSTR